jgi:3-hydroxymyristoyl/3-hydroxydecanoyl-(acyl carrier protein) dehydratase
VTFLPLLSPRDLLAPLAWRHGQPISAGHFIAEAQALAERLPARGRPINLCQDRYHFALGLAAALLRGQTSLMPPNALPETLRLAPAAGDTVYAMTDDAALDVGQLHRVRIERQPGVAPASTVPVIAVDLDAVCLLTSGSTGTPQPHAKRWGQLVANIASQAQRLAQMMGRLSLHGLAVLATVPPQHSYGLESSVLLALLGGAAFDASRPFYPADICSALQRLPHDERHTRALVTTPFHLKTLLLADIALPPVALMLSATAPLSPQLAAQAEAALVGPLIEIYGCTEAGQVASRRTTAGEVWTTLGELHLHREQTHSDEQFIVQGGHVTDPTPLADVLELLDPQHFRLLGRANDLIHVAGKRSSLAHLNFQLNRIEGVDDGAFWLPDEVPETVTRPVAFVVAPGLSDRQIIAALREQLEPVFVPRRVVQVGVLPREATGKLTAGALREFALKTLAKPSAVATDATGDITLHIAADHPAFAGHFPGRPVLPGAALLALVMQALPERPLLAARLGSAPRIDNAKFLAPVGPGARLRLRLQEQGSAVAFEVAHDSAVVARGQFSAGSS